jgi:DNA-binding protein HU-beta
VAKTATKTTAKKAPARKAAASKSVPAKAAETAVAAARRLTKAAAPKAAKKSAGTSASPILTLRHIAEQLSEAHELPKRQANEMLTQVIEMIAKSLKKGDKIRLSGLGILQVRKRAARTGRNPQTGEPIKIKASKKIAFRPAKELKEAV